MTLDDAGTLGNLLHLDNAVGLVIHDTWVGYNHLSPISVAYNLTRTARGAYAGVGRLATSLGEEEIEARLTARAAKSFFSAVADAVLEATPRMPESVWTDDYPRVDIAIHCASREIGNVGGIVLLHSEAQEEDRAPWTVCFRGEIRYVNSGGIGAALKALDRPLKKSLTLKRLSTL